MTSRLVVPQSSEEVTSLVGAVALAILGVIIVTALYVGREIFVPVALAILLSFVLASPVGVLQRLRVPRGIAVVGVVLLAFAIIFALGSLIATQLNRLAGDLPTYQSTIQSKIQSVRGIAGGSSTLERAAGMLQDLGKELDKPKAGSPDKPVSPSLASPLGSRPVTPVPVEVLQPDPGALESLRSLISPLISPLATTGIIVIFVIFILIQREDLRNRLIRLAGSHDLQRTTAALDDAGARPHPLVPEPASDQHRLRRDDRHRAVDHRRSQSRAVGDSRCRPAVRSLYRRFHRRGLSAGAGDRGRSGLVDARLDGHFVLCRRARGRPDGRADGVWTNHRPFAGRRRGIRDVLDRALGTDRTCARNPLDRVPGRARPSRRAAGISRRHVRRPAGAFAARDLLSTHAGGRPDRSRRESRRIPERAIAVVLL